MSEVVSQDPTHQQVDMIVLTDDMIAIKQQIACMQDGFAHLLRPWVGRIQVIEDADEYVQIIESARANNTMPVLFVSLTQMSSGEELEICQYLAQVDQQIKMVILDVGQAMMRQDELAMQLANPLRVMEMCKPMAARQWQQLFVSMARMQIINNQQAKRINILHSTEHDQQLIDQLAQANVNAACIMAELEDARDKAMAADDAKGHFLANMTHELRTPLAIIMGFADLMRDDVQLADEHRRFARSIFDNGQSLLDVLENILLLTQIESSELNPEFVLIDPSVILNKVFAKQLDKANDAGLELTVLPCKEQLLPEQLMLESNWLQMILELLVDNAIKFTVKGTVELSVHWQKRASSYFLHYRVKDTGLGIEPSEHQFIFDHFHQGDNSSSREFGGVGLGLSISRKLARRIGGDIQLTSEPGKGSCFELILPCEQHSGSIAA
ncbi:MAG TPA: hypothetical protein DER01_12770 [Phycisphaerales bacterium]|nr:hypothetical protein [Phycisphaerales bacterium]